jgi:hypothetical protein
MAHICCSPPLNVPAIWRVRSASTGNSSQTLSGLTGHQQQDGGARMKTFPTPEAFVRMTTLQQYIGIEDLCYSYCVTRVVACFEYFFERSKDIATGL